MSDKIKYSGEKMILNYTATADDAGKQLKYILKTRLKISERLLKKLKYQNIKVVLP
jgi:hypothetical protein